MEEGLEGENLELKIKRMLKRSEEKKEKKRKTSSAEAKDPGHFTGP